MNPTLVNIVFGTLAGLMVLLALFLVFVSLGGGRNKTTNRLQLSAAVLAGGAGALAWSMGGLFGLCVAIVSAGALLLLGRECLRAYGDKAGW